MTGTDLEEGLRGVGRLSPERRRASASCISYDPARASARRATSCRRAMYRPRCAQGKVGPRGGLYITHAPSRPGAWCGAISRAWSSAAPTAASISSRRPGRRGADRALHDGRRRVPRRLHDGAAGAVRRGRGLGRRARRQSPGRQRRRQLDRVRRHRRRRDAAAGCAAHGAFHEPDEAAIERGGRARAGAARQAGRRSRRRSASGSTT